MPAVLEKYGQVNTGTESMHSKFFHLGKERFQINIKNDYDYINGIKESIRFFSLDLPAEIKEIFIPFSEAPVFWIYESSLLNQIEEFMKFNLVRGSYLELHKSIKENYSKWVTTKLKSEKDYYATLTINFIERDINKHNFFKLIIKAIILTYQSSYYNPPRALEILTNTLDLMNNIRLNDLAKTELRYILNLYAGFVHLKENDQERAKSAFRDALEVKPQGSTAKIYCALTELNLGKEDAAIFLLREVYNYDVHRLTVAIKTNNTGMFSYFFRNAFIYNVFYEKDFIKAFNGIEAMLNENRLYDSNQLAITKEKLESLKLKKMDEYYDEEIAKSISFFEKIIQNYSSSKNSLLIVLAPEFQKRINTLIEQIISKIKGKFYREVQEKISEFDANIAENANAQKHLIEELEKFKVKSREALAVSIKEINENFDADVQALERKVDDLPNVDRFNPRVSMSNNMTYNIIIAFVLFFIGGFSGYSDKSVSDTSELNSIFTYILISGSKWGAISFVIGAVISTILSAIVLLERSDMKHKYLRKINYLKIEKERAVVDTKANFAHKEKIMNESISNSINMTNKRAEELKAQKIEAERTYLIEAEEKINAILPSLQEIQS